MISELAIKNFAIIDDLRIRFKEGLTILSGETGAGKSIIINAVNFLLGSRVSAGLIRAGSEKAELEAGFIIPKKSHAAEVMKECGFDPQDELIIRRIISKDNRNKIYVNGRLTPVQQLISITENLASISGQHAHQGLLKEDQHLMVLDQFGGLMNLREKIKENYQKILPLIKKYNELKSIQNRRDDQKALFEFQKEEIVNAALQPDEDKALEKERTILKNSEKLLSSLHECVDALYDSSGSVTEQLSEIRRKMEAVSQIDTNLNRASQKIDDVTLGVEDITANLRDYLQHIEMDEARLEAVEERIDEINKLKRKYGGSLDAINDYLHKITMELNGLENVAEDILKTDELLKKLSEGIKFLSSEISRKRKNAAQEFSKRVEKELSDLKMQGTKFRVKFESCPADKSVNPYLSMNGCAINEAGFDRALFILSPNIGEELKPLAAIASGGELSRVVLALKAILAKTGAVETIVFDEVDAGIGGGTSEIVGKKLFDLSKYHQVICITHLAQIAKFGLNHFKISKHISGGRTCTKIEPMNNKQRVEEIARMLGGEKITAATRNHAKELLTK